MDISPNSANKLCEKILNTLVTWDAIGATLQCGAMEDKARGRIADAIQSWLRCESSNLRVLPEYRPPVESGKSALKVDFAIFNPNSVNQASLNIRALIELKTNYATQRARGPKTPRELAHGEFGKRIPSALGQAAAYREITGAASAFVLYLVCDPRRTEPLPEGRRDNGWQYWRRLHDVPAQDITRVKKTIMILARRHRVEILGQSVSVDNTGQPNFYCCLLTVPEPDLLKNEPPFTDPMIWHFLEVGGRGTTIKERQEVRRLCKDNSFSETTYYFWYTKFRGWGKVPTSKT